MRNLLLMGAVGAALVLGAPASAQYVFLDVNGDTQCTNADVLSSSVTSIDIYFDTNHNLDGSTATCQTGPEELTINSYAFVVKASGPGTVTYGAWTDNMGFTTPGGGGAVLSDNVTYWIGQASGTGSPAGKYKVGTLAVTITGSPILQFLPNTPLDGQALTAFGALCFGNDQDNTIKLGSDFQDSCASGVINPVVDTTWGKIKQRYLKK